MSLCRFEEGLVIAVGKGEPADVMLQYGFKNVLSIDEYASYFDGIDPLSPYKTWKTRSLIDKAEKEPCKPPHTRNVFSERVEAAFVVSDPVDWGRDIQVLCDVLRSGGLPGRENSHQPPLFFANDDLEYQVSQLCKLDRVHDNALEYTCFGKPNPSVFRNAENILSHLPCCPNVEAYKGNSTITGTHLFKTIYMVGDNPAVDINGARQAGHPWFSILTRTGVFKGKENDPQFPADLVVDNVGDAVDYILRTEGFV
ncbi:putative CDP-alcohol phosphatidyltransferase class-I family protein C22A12-08c [Nymphaea thermarum]|nr:putative CDP-alcohol phosphatidyltransferase class-I family protein C22A12-08c [Nymphaea thermarum]